MAVQCAGVHYTVGEDTFFKVWLFAEQKLNYVQLVVPEHQNDFKIVQKWVLIMFVCISLYKGIIRGKLVVMGFFIF